MTEEEQPRVPQTAEQEIEAARALFRDNRPDQAHARLTSAARRHRRHPQLRYLLAGFDLSRGRTEAAVDGFLAALRHAAEPAMRRDCARWIARLVNGSDAPKAVARITPADLQLCLETGGGDPQPLAIAAIRILKAGAWRSVFATGRAKGWPVAARRLLNPEAAALLDAPVLRLALTQAILMDPEMELLLTALRAEILLGEDHEAHVARFRPVLATQCWLNQFMFDEGARESAEVNRRMTGTEAGAGDWDLALYRPLSELKGAGAEAADDDWRALHALSVAEPRAEIRAGADLPDLTPLPAESEPVRAQYEAAPYPRWRHLPEINEGERRGMLAHFAPDRAWRGPLKVLIAGCGTGRQALVAARGYGTDADVLAVDISRRSLGYARRRAEDAALPNLKFALADIARLDTLSERFDVIECFGVLHHLEDPLAGWRTLVSLLADGGIMQVALYRGAGRLHCAAARAVAREMGLGSADADIRRFRRHVLTHPTEGLNQVLLSIGDFYSLSGCRDLAFHARERDYTLDEIAAALGHLGLEFLGLQVSGAVRRRFDARFPEPGAFRSLAAWRRFEAENARDFDALYRLWCRRVRA